MLIWGARHFVEVVGSNPTSELRPFWFAKITAMFMQKGCGCVFKGNLGKILLAAIVGYCICGQIGAIVMGAVAMFLMPNGDGQR